MTLRRLGSIAAILLFAGSAEAATVKIGFINSITGPQAPIGENLTNGVTLAVDDLKKQRIDVEIIREDDAGDPARSAAALGKLAADGNVTGVVGPYSSQCAAADVKVAEASHVPLLIPVATKDDLTRLGYRWVFRLGATSKDDATILLDMALSVGKPTTLAIIHENSDFGISDANAAKTYAAAIGLKVVAVEAYPPGNADFHTPLARIKAKNPDLLFMASYVADAIQLMREARALRLTPKAFLGAGAGFATQAFARERDISENVLTSTQWASDVNWPGAKDFFARYVARFTKQPTYHAAVAYTAAVIMAESAARGGDRNQTRLALKSGHWNGVMGNVTFADYEGYTNQNKHQMLVQQIHAGAFRTVYPGFGHPVYPFPGWK